MWVGDFEHGPVAVHQGRAIKTHLSAWIDCHSRYIVGARYYVRENLDILADSLLRAWGQHGASRELYVDNAKIYHAKALTLACAALNIRLLHRPPRDPPAGGLIERFFRTVQEQLEAEVRAAALLTLVVTQLGDVPRRGKDRLYEQILERAERTEGTLLLVFDEAHLLDAAALTDVRLLISSALDVRPPLKILLAGQETLRATLRRTGHADLLNRVSVRYQLRPLAKDQTTRYIDFQMTQAGGSPKTFDDSVKDLIHDFTGGVPRQINNLATACLLQATARKLPRIDDDLFQQAAQEVQLP